MNGLAIGTTTILTGVTLSIGGGIMVGATDAPCTSANAGSIQFTGYDFKYCNGYSWSSMRGNDPHCTHQDIDYYPGEWVKCGDTPIICGEDGERLGDVDDTCRFPF